MFLTSLLSLIVQPPSLPTKRRIRALAILGKGSLAKDDGQRHLSLLADILFGAHGINPRHSAGSEAAEFTARCTGWVPIAWAGHDAAWYRQGCAGGGAAAQEDVQCLFTCSSFGSGGSQ